MNETLFDVIASSKSKWLDAHLNLVESVTLEGAGLHGLELGLYRIALMRVGTAPKPKPERPFFWDPVWTDEYRDSVGVVKPKPVEPPSWDDLPDWADWRAQDYTGAWWVYENKPAQFDGIFGVVSGKTKHLLSHMSSPNWRDTLEQRPAPEPLCPVCGKPASEHPDGLFCCGHCKGRAKHKTKRAGKFAGYHRVFCTECGARTTLWSDGSLARAAWNRRA